VCDDPSLPWGRNSEPAFVTDGFRNWKKAVEKFREHEACHTHFLAVHHMQTQSRTIMTQLDTHQAQQQRTTAKCLKVVISSVQYLAREGIALRGHENEGGHLNMLLQLRANDVPEFKSWLKRIKVTCHRPYKMKF